MDTKQKNVNNHSVVDATEVKGKKKQAASCSYALKATAAHLETLKNANLLGEQEYEEMKTLLNGAARTYVQLTFGF